MSEEEKLGTETKTEGYGNAAVTRRFTVSDLPVGQTQTVNAAVKRLVGTETKPRVKG